MNGNDKSGLSRRTLLQAALGGVALGWQQSEAAELPLITRSIPSTGEPLPVAG